MNNAHILETCQGTLPDLFHEYLEKSGVALAHDEHFQRRITRPGGKIDIYDARAEIKKALTSQVSKQYLGVLKGLSFRRMVELILGQIYPVGLLGARSPILAAQMSPDGGLYIISSGEAQPLRRIAHTTPTVGPFAPMGMIANAYIDPAGRIVVLQMDIDILDQEGREHALAQLMRDRGLDLERLGQGESHIIDGAVRFVVTPSQFDGGTDIFDVSDGRRGIVAVMGGLIDYPLLGSLAEFFSQVLHEGVVLTSHHDLHQRLRDSLLPTTPTGEVFGRLLDMQHYLNKKRVTYASKSFMLPTFNDAIETTTTAVDSLGLNPWAKELSAFILLFYTAYMDGFSMDKILVEYRLKEYPAPGGGGKKMVVQLPGLPLDVAAEITTYFKRAEMNPDGELRISNSVTSHINFKGTSLIEISADQHYTSRSTRDGQGDTGAFMENLTAPVQVHGTEYGSVLQQLIEMGSHLGLSIFDPEGARRMHELIADHWHRLDLPWMRTFHILRLQIETLPPGTSFRLDCSQPGRIVITAAARRERWRFNENDNGELQLEKILAPAAGADPDVYRDILACDAEAERIALLQDSVDGYRHRLEDDTHLAGRIGRPSLNLRKLAERAPSRAWADFPAYLTGRVDKLTEAFAGQILETVLARVFPRETVRVEAEMVARSATALGPLAFVKWCSLCVDASAAAAGMIADTKRSVASTWFLDFADVVGACMQRATEELQSFVEPMSGRMPGGGRVRPRSVVGETTQRMTATALQTAALGGVLLQLSAEMAGLRGAE